MRSRTVRPVSASDRPTTGGIPAQPGSIRSADPKPSISGTSALRVSPDNSNSRKEADPQARQSKYRLTKYRRSLIGTDVITVVLAVLLTNVLSSSAAQPWTSWLLSVTLVLGWLMAMVLGGVWDARTVDAGAPQYRRILLVGATLCLGTGVVGYLTGLELARSLLLIALPAGTAGLLLAHWGWRLHLLRQRRSGHLWRSVLVVGERVSAGAVCSTVRDHPAAGYQVVGVYLLRDRLRRAGTIDDVAGYAVVGNAAPTDVATAAPADIATAAEVTAAATARGAGFVALADDPDQLLDELLLSLAGSGIELLVASDLVDGADPVAKIDESDPELFRVSEVKRSRALAKSAFDLIVALLGLLLLSPFMLVTAFAVLMADGGSVIHRTNYVGVDGAVFSGWSFRCSPHGVKARPVLRTAADVDSGYVLATTRVGRLLRRTGLEDAPRLVNVLRRQMSLVGPRPNPAGEIDHRAPQVRPGVTGHWRTTPGSAASGSRHDVNDAVNWSAGADITVIVKTIGMGLTGRLSGS